MPDGRAARWRRRTQGPGMRGHRRRDAIEDLHRERGLRTVRGGRWITLAAPLARRAGHGHAGQPYRRCALYGPRLRSGPGGRGHETIKLAYVSRLAVRGRSPNAASATDCARPRTHARRMRAARPGFAVGVGPAAGLDTKGGTMGRRYADGRVAADAGLNGKLYVFGGPRVGGVATPI